MATTEQFQERLQRAGREAVQKCLSEGGLPEVPRGEARFTSVEALALAAGDAVSLEVFEQQLADSGMGAPHYPRLSRVACKTKPRKRRKLADDPS